MTRRLLLGVAAGLLIGLFLGEHARILQGLAEIYIRLLQVTVLPYLVVAMVLGLGRLDPKVVRPYLRYSLAALAAVWAVTLTVIAVLPHAFPVSESASFFSSSLVEPRTSLGLVDLYITANPFNALANTLVPAVTLFSAMVGVALMGVPEKERLLGPLETVMQAIARLTSFVVRLTPFGIIPIVAVAAGTLSGDQASRLEVYLITFVIAALLLGLVLLPLLVSWLTPFRYREILGIATDALLTAFLTSSVFVVLPMLVEHSRDLARRHGITGPEGELVPEVLVPIAFNFPTAGKLLTLLFVPFAAWLTGEALAPGAYPALLGAGLTSYFAKAQVALPFLLDVVGAPQDAFQLYLPSSILTGKFDSAVGAMSLLALALLVIAASVGRLRLTVARGLGVAAALLGMVVATTAGTRVVLRTVVDTTYTRAEALTSMRARRTELPAPTMLRADTLQPAPAGIPAMDRIRTRGALRAGFLSGRMPLAFANAAGEPVGFDVEMLSQLSKDLGVSLQLVPMQMAQVDSFLVAGIVDVVPSIPHTHHQVLRVRLSEPYMQGTIGLIVPDQLRDEFASLERLRSHDSLRIGLVADADLYEDYVQAMAGPVPYRLIPLVADPDSVLGHDLQGVDAVIILAEVGTAWTLLYPAYTVVTPQPLVIRRPLAFATAPTAEDLGSLLNAWLRLQEARGNTARGYDWWVLGKGAQSDVKRWSIGHDLLHWF